MSADRVNKQEKQTREKHSFGVDSPAPQSVSTSGGMEMRDQHCQAQDLYVTVEYSG